MSLYVDAVPRNMVYLKHKEKPHRLRFVASGGASFLWRFLGWCAEVGGVTTGFEESCCEVGDLGRDLVPGLPALLLDQYLALVGGEVVVG